MSLRPTARQPCYSYWVPVEVSTDTIRHVFSNYGQVLDIQKQVHPDFPEIELRGRPSGPGQSHVVGPRGDLCFELSVQSLLPWPTLVLPLL